jgi:hypothetical protein
MIPDDVRRFVLTSISSVPYLEAVLLFHGEPKVERTVVEVASLLYLPEQRIAALLSALCEAGLVKVGAGPAKSYLYAPRDEALAMAIDRLASVYASDMIGVTHLIHDSTQKDAQRFADAFKLRKER